MRRQQVRQRRRLPLVQRGQRPEGACDPAGRIPDPPVLRVLRRSQKAVQPVAGARAAQQRPFQPADGAPEKHRLHAAGRERVFERGKQVGRGEAGCNRVGRKAQEGAGGRSAERRAGAVIRHEAPAAEFHRDPPAEIAVGRNEGRAFTALRRVA